jgi:hypothetical protein
MNMLHLELLLLIMPQVKENGEKQDLVLLFFGLLMVKEVWMVMDMSIYLNYRIP